MRIDRSQRKIEIQFITIIQTFEMNVPKQRHLLKKAGNKIPFE